MEEKNRTYTGADFASYHAGTMPSAEMHELERAALEDRFLADALEGYVHAPAFENDIVELKGRMSEKTKRNNIFSLSSIAGNAWLRIAALFIIIAGAGYFFYRVNYVDKENSLAKNEVRVSTDSEDSAGLINKDPESSNNNATSENQQASVFEQKEKIILPPASSQKEKEAFDIRQNAESETGPAPLSRSKDRSNSDSAYTEEVRKEYDAQAVKEYVLEGKVTDEEGNALPFVSVADKNRNTETVTDTAGRFFLRSQDSNIIAIASATGYASKSFTLKKDKQPTIEINKNKANLNEVVITANAKRKHIKESDPQSKELNGKVSGVQTTTTGPQPSGGHDKFDQYLNENTAPIYDRNGERLKGDVLLSFAVNKKGRPENIKVVKSSCTVCTKEAIKLLQKGPDWIAAKDKEITVMIKF